MYCCCTVVARHPMYDTCEVWCMLEVLVIKDTDGIDEDKEKERAREGEDKMT